MKDKELLQMLEVLGKNSRRSFAASDVVEGEVKEREDQLCAAMIRKIVGNSNFNSSTNNNRRSFAASDPSLSLSSNSKSSVNKVKLLTQFILNGKIA